tara:strand:- start:18228 stop:18548 length:321 start_codon:yes stop_codon:yes gene_type:complete
MSHFAEIDSNGIVQRVIVAEQDFIDSGAVGDAANWIQTSYNNNIRKQFAGIGFTYDSAKDKFIAPQPYASWSLDGNDDWQPPVAMPEDDKRYYWDEDTTNWVEITE